MAFNLINNITNTVFQPVQTVGKGLVDLLGGVASLLGGGSGNVSLADAVRNESGALPAVQDALGNEAAKVDTAAAGLEAAIGTAGEIRNQLVLAQEPGADPAAIQQEIAQLQEQLVAIADTASHDGENWLKAPISTADGQPVDGADAAALEKQVVTAVIRDADGDVEIETVNVALDSANVLFDTGGSAANASDAATTRGILDIEAENAAGGSVAGSSVSTLDISKLADYRGADGLADENASDAEVLGAMVAHVDRQIGTMKAAAAGFTSVSARIGLQDSLADALSGGLDERIVRLVDAGLDGASTRLKALQVREQLAVEALSIANGDAENMLSLFRAGTDTDA